MYLQIIVASVALLARGASAACSRSALQTASDAFFKSAFAKSPTPAGITLAQSVKITQNNQILPNLAATAYGNLTGLLKPFSIKVIEVETCNILSLILATENGAPAIVSLRMKLDAEKGEVMQVELLNALKGSHALFDTDALKSPEDPIWNVHMIGDYTRDQLVKIGDSYADGIQSGKDAVVMAGPECPRFENGVKTTDHCNRNMTLFAWPVRDRRWYADTETGNVVASFFFSYREGTGLMKQMGIRPANMTTGLWLHEYFKVVNGKIVNVQAAMQTLDAEYKDVWS